MAAFCLTKSCRQFPKRILFKCLFILGLLTSVYFLDVKMDLRRKMPAADLKLKSFNETTDRIPVKEFYPNIRIPTVTTGKVNCHKLIMGDKEEQNQVNVLSGTQQKRIPKSALHYIQISKNCSYFRTERKYILDPLTPEEGEFPIAFSILMHKDVEQSERLLRAIYRPQNYYCIHVDKKSPIEVKKAMKRIASCFDNVFLSSKLIDVQWGSYSVLEPEITCMQDLWKYDWRYFINLTGQEFPLKTNAELVSILQALNGANSIEGTIKRMTASSRDRTRFVHDGIKNRRIRKPPPPVNVTFFKGSVHIVAQRGFIDFVIHDKRAKLLRNFLKDSGVPDETLFATLNYNKQLKVPGAYLGEPETDKIDAPEGVFPKNPFIARFKNWGNTIFNWPCYGKRLRLLCIFGYGDLPLLASRKELFANKFHADFEPEAYDCLEELHYNKTLEQIKHGLKFNVSFYQHLDIVHNHS